MACWLEGQAMSIAESQVSGKSELLTEMATEMGLLAGTKFDRPPHCEQCDRLESECTCPPVEPDRLAPGRQTARIAIEKRKHGRTMTVIRGLNAVDNDLDVLLKRLKNACGAGGTVSEDGIEVQGNHADRVRTELLRIGYRV